MTPTMTAMRDWHWWVDGPWYFWSDVCQHHSRSQGSIRHRGSISVNVVIPTWAEGVSTGAISNISINVRRLWFSSVGSLLRCRGFSGGDFPLCPASLGGKVGRVVEVKEEKQHRPCVVEGDGVEQPWIITVGTNEHVVAGVTHYSHELRLQIRWFDIITATNCAYKSYDSILLTATNCTCHHRTHGTQGNFLRFNSWHSWFWCFINWFTKLIQHSQQKLSANYMFNNITSQE